MGFGIQNSKGRVLRGMGTRHLVQPTNPNRLGITIFAFTGSVGSDLPIRGSRFEIARYRWGLLCRTDQRGTGASNQLLALYERASPTDNSPIVPVSNTFRGKQLILTPNAAFDYGTMVPRRFSRVNDEDRKRTLSGRGLFCHGTSWVAQVGQGYWTKSKCGSGGSCGRTQALRLEALGFGEHPLDFAGEF